MKKLFLLIFISILGICNKNNAQEPKLMTNFGNTGDYIAIDSKNKYIVSADITGNIKIWDLEKRRELNNFNNNIGINNIKLEDVEKQIKILFIDEPTAYIQTYSIDKKINSSEKKLTVPEKTIYTSFFEKKPLLFTIQTKGYTIIHSESGKAILNIKCEKMVFAREAISFDEEIFVVYDQGKITGYNIEKGKKMFSYNSENDIIGLQITPDNKSILTLSEQGVIKTINVENGNLIQSHKMPANNYKFLKLSSDGKAIAVLRQSNTSKKRYALDIMNTQNFEILYNDDNIICPKSSFKLSNILLFSNDNKKIIYRKNTIKIVDINTKKIIDINAMSHNISLFRLTSDKKNILLSNKFGKFKLFNFEKNKFVHVSGITQNEEIKKFLLTANEKNIITVGETHIKIWKYPELIITDSVRIKYSHNKIKLSNDGELCYDRNLCFTKNLSVHELDSKIINENNESFKNNYVAFSNNNEYIANLINNEKNNNKIHIYSRKDGKLISEINLNEKSGNNFTFSNDDKLIAINNRERIFIWDIESKKCIADIPLDKHIISSFIINHSKVAIYLQSSEKGTVFLYDLITNKFITTILNNEYINFVFDFSPNEKYLIYGGYNGIIKMVDTKTGKLILTFFDIPNSSDWIAITPDGYFDGTEDGFNYLHFVKAEEIIPLKSLFETYYTPNLIPRILGGEQFTENKINVNSLLPTPLVEIITSQKNASVSVSKLDVKIKATDQGGGIDEIRLYHNDKLIDGTQRGFKPQSSSGNTETKTFTITLVNGENRIKATAFNSQRTESIPDEIVINYKAPAITKPSMYVLAVGINTYKNPKYNLNYAKNDADGFVKALQAGASTIFEKVLVTVVNDEQATKTGILNAVEKIKSVAKAEDVFVFYYAGHGVMSAGTATIPAEFYLVPHDVVKMYDDDAALNTNAISAKTIAEFSKTLKPQKQLFVLDACQSGGALQTFATRGAAEEKAIAQLSRSTGTYFIAASGSEQFATEVATLGHGIFTYSIIQSLQGSCKVQDGKVTVNLLKGCVEDMVPDLSTKYKGQPQYPTGYGYGQDFPIGIVK